MARGQGRISDNELNSGLINELDAKALQSGLDNLAGVGRTTETVKGVSDAFALHQADLASQAIGKGASLVGINDTGSLLAATSVEGALAELASRPSVRIVNGNYSDMSTVVEVSATYIKTIPIGFNALKGRISCKYTAGSFINWMNITFSTDILKTICFNVQTSGNNYTGLGTDTYLTSIGIGVNSNIQVQSVVIIGSNLVITFKNTASITETFKINFLAWEVEG